MTVPKVVPKYGKSRLTKRRVEVVRIDFDNQLVEVKDDCDNTSILNFKEIDFEYTDMDLDDMYVFLRALYSPKEVVERLCNARGLKP
jgi:hypothetical protein